MIKKGDWTFIWLARISRIRRVTAIKNNRRALKPHGSRFKTISIRDYDKRPGGQIIPHLLTEVEGSSYSFLSGVWCWPLLEPGHGSTLAIPVCADTQLPPQHWPACPAGSMGLRIGMVGREWRLGGPWKEWLGWEKMNHIPLCQLPGKGNSLERHVFQGAIHLWEYIDGPYTEHNRLAHNITLFSL